MNNFKKLLLKINCSNTRIGFYFKNEEYFKTQIGGIFTIIYFFIIILIVLYFGSDFIYRENPTLIQQDIFPIKYPNYSIDNTYFTFSIRIEDNDGKVIDKPNLIYLEFIYYHYEIRNGVWQLIEEIPMNYSLCKESAFSNSIGDFDQNVKNDDSIEKNSNISSYSNNTQNFNNNLINNKISSKNKLNLNSSFCMDFNNLEFGAFWDETYVKFIRSYAKQCMPGHINPSGQICGTQHEFEELKKNRIFLSQYFPNNFYDSDNYEFPLDITYNTHFFMLDEKILKKFSYFFKLVKSTTDYGWLFKHEKKYNEFSIDLILNDFISKESLPINQQSNLGEVYIFFNRKKQEFSRNFQKIYNLAANIGGVISLCYIVFEYIVNWFNNYLK